MISSNRETCDGHIFLIIVVSKIWVGVSHWLVQVTFDANRELLTPPRKRDLISGVWNAVEMAVDSIYLNIQLSLVY